MERLLWLIMILGMSLTAFSQTDTMQIRDISNDWRMLSSDEGIVPIVDMESFSGNSLYVPVPLSEYRGNLLRINSEEEISLLSEGDLLNIFTGDLWLEIDSLYNKHGDSVIYTLYNRPLHPYTIHTGIYRVTDSLTASRIRSEQVIIESNESSELRNVLIVSFVVIILFVAVLYFYYPRLTQEFFKLQRAVSFRELDENLMKTRPLSIINIFYYLLESMLSAWVLFVLIQYADYDLRFRFFHFSGFWNGLFIWVQMAGVIFVLLFLKYILVWMFIKLFRLSGFFVNHFYNYIRLGLLIYAFLALLIFAMVFTFGYTGVEFYRGWIIVLLVMIAARSVLIFFKLMNESSHTILHLFSYLCATELIPLLFIVSWGY
jgi:hypothetical protein